MTNAPFWLGGIAATMAASVTHPLDVAKVRMQTIETAPGAKKPSILHVLRASIHDSGIRSVYTGLTAAWTRQMSYSLVRIGTYEEFKSRLSRNGPPSGLALIAAASLAGGLGGIVGNPAGASFSYIILVRMTSDSMRPPENRYRYSNAITGLFSLAKEEGFRGLGRGIGTNTTRAVLMNASQVGSYDFFKSKLLQHSDRILNYQFKDNLLLHVVSSLLAGTFATTVCSPADVMRTRIMSHQKSLYYTSLPPLFEKRVREFYSKGGHLHSSD
ncbi:hypothetical protein MIND_00441400 [Mycena indigotica]|uniref:Uncharacterized protein n=1 Tax=Mycena indigotica TaxID=2126181 RepID=A0A8H6SW20_9AGAR|nr:uncharacterized protein MIND_00441400 [Mycena indigotica]KAF7306501.1 hypothetical protein MIND_00441400 [Mycena indigotica]